MFFSFYRKCKIIGSFWEIWELTFRMYASRLFQQGLTSMAGSEGKHYKAEAREDQGEEDVNLGEGAVQGSPC